MALDIQVIGGVAPKARQRVYFAPNTDAGFIDAVAASLHATPPPDSVSISWGAAESNWTQQARNAMDAVFAQLVAKGIPVFAASGDGGSADGTGSDVTDFPASAPHATGCGGTVLAGSGTTITSEVAWPGSGGGVSKMFPAPAYQSGLGLSGRGVPDISGDAAPQSGYTVFVGSTSPFTFGGTSAVAPLWAGLTALLVGALGHAVGDLNAKLYQLIGTTALRDITSGTNGGFSAKAGWDAVTGCGTPVGQELLTRLESQPVRQWSRRDVGRQRQRVSRRPVDPEHRCAREPRRELHDLRPAHLWFLERDRSDADVHADHLSERPEHLPDLHWLSDAAAAGERVPREPCRVLRGVPREWSRRAEAAVRLGRSASPRVSPGRAAGGTETTRRGETPDRPQPAALTRR